MKTKDIVTVVIAGLLIILSGFFAYKMLVVDKKAAEQSSKAPQVTEKKFTGEIDETTLKAITEKKDYGEASLDNIGRTNPFGPIN